LEVRRGFLLGWLGSKSKSNAGEESNDSLKIYGNQIKKVSAWKYSFK